VSIPGERYKTGADHLVPLSDLAWKQLEELPRWPECDWVFTLDGQGPVRAFGRLKNRLDTAANRQLGREMQRWRLHDLRVTVRSNLSRLGFRDEVCEAVIGHTPAHIKRTYNKHRFIEERREALQAWAEHVMGVVKRG
jgi:integrase